MNGNERRAAGDRPERDDEIEIVEVVGLDEDAPPPGDDDAEIEVRFDDVEEDVYVLDGDEVDGHGAPADEGARGDRERLVRLHADFDNYKKRVEKEKEDFYVHATSRLVERLLPVLDNFERALLHAREDPGATGDGFVDGVRLIRKQLLDELSKQGLREVEAVGKPFDPTRHEAVATESDPDTEPNLVTLELQRGYLFHDRLLRPALVRVNTAPEPDAVDGDRAPDDGPNTMES